MPTKAKEPSWWPIERTQRFLDVLTFLHTKGVYQKRLPEFALEVDMTLSGLKAVLRRGVELRVIDRLAGAHPTIGVGRLPNQYRALMAPEEWLEIREAMVNKKLSERTARIQRREAERAQAKALERGESMSASEVAAAFERPTWTSAVVPLEATTVRDDEVDGWLNAVDFDPYND